MILFRRIRITRPKTLTESDVGRFSYWDASKFTLTLEGELLVPSDELTAYEEELEVEEFPKEIKLAGAPFMNWKDLIDAVAARTPQARALIRYLESNPYHKVLRMPHVEVDEEGNEVRKLAPFLLNKDQVDEISFNEREKFNAASSSGRPAQMISVRYKGGKRGEPGIAFRTVVDEVDGPNPKKFYWFDTPSTYNRFWFEELKKYAPRSMDPEAHGGLKVKRRGVEGSPKWAEEVRRPLVKPIVDDHLDEIVAELERFFKVIPDDWSKLLLGPGGRKVSISIDPRAEQLSRLVKSSPRDRTSLMTADQHKAYSHLQRTRNLLLARKRGAATPAERLKYDREARNMKQEMSRISDQATDPKYKIYVLVKLPLRSFITKLRREIGAAEPREDKTSGLMTVKTSLKGFGRLMDQFDPGTPMQAMPAQLLAAVGLPPEKSGPQSSRIKMGFREDMYEIIKHAIERKHHVDCNVTFVDNYGNIYYEQREVDYSIADEDDNEY